MWDARLGMVVETEFSAVDLEKID
ncbi:hypothetical protein XBKB1_4210017 [Xenorhabdus bovienii str. kraussei Becker Underwood]|uniref:Uncharacterized protein n=1 Tax=Xenorhabdus bovienii str. kraussei Becker Underwood TaxID=1398204 RepID=A0A077Q1J0_XENBV|nr:hypothetical protein XBKB1_4210017 [Xenorhabdus bovienii str. kraussei Becker Underwood]